MSFPLARWIDQHPGRPHDLARSGMRGELRSAERLLRRPSSGEEGPVRRRLARRIGVPAERIFLTHGATEGDHLVLSFLAAQLRRHRAHRTFWTPMVEYPPLLAQAGWAGFARTGHASRAAVLVLSRPNNPTGLRQARPTAQRHAHLLVDETFREFTRGRSLASPGEPRLWTTGTLTKAYGADAVRCGWVVAPPEAAEEFSEFHGVATDALPPTSLGVAERFLVQAETVLRESRAIFRQNQHRLREEFPDAAGLAAPVYLDSHRAMNGERLAREALREGILVCPGRFFGSPRSVRICLTRRRFPVDLAAYLSVRARHLTVRAPGAVGG